ncbi:MAG: tRNA pseudouridine(55) synthase TruB [Oscillospiraceae bacterium]
MKSGVIILDKPKGWTSHDAVAKLRRLLGERRVGHGGTLDPLATGVLPVFIGRATRAADYITFADKEYVAKMRLGIITDTQDITGKVLSVCDDKPSLEAIKSVLKEFTGEILQVPPMYSAIKKGGEKLYELARKGIEVPREGRPVKIYRLELTGCDGDEYELHICCSKGTYVRTLCDDIGRRLGCGACMTALRRTRNGPFTLEQAVTISEVSEWAEKGRAEPDFIKSIDCLWPELPKTLGDERKIRNGAAYRVSLPDGRYRVYGENGDFLMLGEVRQGMMKTIKSFFEVDNDGK